MPRRDARVLRRLASGNEEAAAGATMNRQPVSGTNTLSDIKPSKDLYRVFFDGQCEICQACLSWLMTLDRHGRTQCLAIGREVLSAVDRRFDLDDCPIKIRVLRLRRKKSRHEKEIPCKPRIQMRIRVSAGLTRLEVRGFPWERGNCLREDMHRDGRAEALSAIVWRKPNLCFRSIPHQWAKNL